jgi:osmotically-inducible protein OsmY
VTDDEVRAAQIDHAKARAPLIVEERRLTEDERIQSVVMDALAHDARLTGKIGVESNASVVRLTGWTSTVGQAERAGRMARGVTGVRYVENLIRPRVGGMVSS